MKFHVGDKVRVGVNKYKIMPKGTIGIVVCVVGASVIDEVKYYYVQLEEFMPLLFDKDELEQVELIKQPEWDEMNPL